MSNRITGIIFSVFMLFLLAGCSAAGRSSKTDPSAPPPLRVGVTTNYPPIIFGQDNEVTGVEADLARRLGAELGRPVRFVKLGWGKQIPSLLAGETDIIMSGMSVTDVRKIRIDFSEPYLSSGQIAAFRVKDASAYNSLEIIRQSPVTVGVVEGTTAEAYVKKNFHSAGISLLGKARDGAFDLKMNRIDLFVHDAPSILWLVAENEADITAFWEPFNEEHFAWGVRRGDEELLLQVNAALGRWKQDGTLEDILRRWLPEKFLERFR
jgi:polar amino acid transport system substrate-binding protein